MKKSAILALLLALLVLGGCGNSSSAEQTAPGQSLTPFSVGQPEEEEDDGDAVVIRDKLFIAQVNEIYINYEQYLGKTIKYEGVYVNGYYPPDDMTFHYVFRYGPGCCGDDGDVGFEIAWEGEYPEENEWVEITGVLEQYDFHGWPTLRLNAQSIKVMEERGQEFVQA